MLCDTVPQGLQVSALVTVETGGFDRKAKFLQKAVRRLLSRRSAQLSSGQVDAAKTLGHTAEPQDLTQD